MHILTHEFRLSWRALLIWTASITGFLALIILLFPEIEKEMDLISQSFASLGSFTSAMGLDRLNMATFIGFYAVECGNVLGIGGGIFSASFASNILAKEEREKTAEYLLSHPIARRQIYIEKYLALLLQILLFNLVILGFSIACTSLINVEIEWAKFFQLHFSLFLAQIQIASICYGVSAFLQGGGAGLGVGIGISFYFLNIIANMSESAKFFHYFTPYTFTNAAEIFDKGHLDGAQIAFGFCISLLVVIIGFLKYNRKDI